MNLPQKILIASICSGPLIGSLLGQSLQDLQRLQREFEASRNILKAGPEIREMIDSEVPSLESLTIGRPSLKVDSIGYFGYQFFNNRTRLKLWENLPLPADYRLGAGDEIIISLWGESQYRNAHVINRGGNIYIDKVGLVPLTGKTIGEATDYLKRHFGQVYATLRNPNPTTFIDVAIGNLKMINVSFIGEVNQPGIHALHPFSRVTTGLIQAGGIALSGSLRSLQVIRDGQLVTTVDLYAYLLQGEGTADLQLRDQDIVYIPLRQSTVTISGEVHRPAIYEALPGEDIGTMLAYSGFIKPLAGMLAEIQRVVPPEFRATDDDAFFTLYVTLDKIKDVASQDGDKIIVQTVLPAAKEVYVYGQVKRPGKFSYQDSMRVLDLLRMAGGIDDESFWKTVYTEKAELIRRDMNNEYALTLPINLMALKAGDDSQNLMLQNFDQLVIRSNPYNDAPKNVIIVGEINVPGVYVIQEDNETLENLFARAGGFTTRVFEPGIRMHRGGERVILRDYSIAVNHGDSVFVPIHPGVVRVIGEVYTPGLIHFRGDMSMWDYIESAGGITLEAKPNAISVEYANGDVRIRKFLYSPKIEEGATIVIHRDQENPPFDPTAFLTSLTSVIGSIATVVIILSTR